MGGKHRGKEVEKETQITRNSKESRHQKNRKTHTYKNISKSKIKKEIKNSISPFKKQTHTGPVFFSLKRHDHFKFPRSIASKGQRSH